MERRHEELLQTRLEEIIDKGCATLLWSELYRWFNKKRLTKNDYQKVIRMWDEISKKEYGDLKFVGFVPYGPNETNGGVVLLASKRIRPFSELTEP